MAGERPFESPGAGPTHASRRWRAMPRWARWSVRAPLLSEQLRLVVLAMVAGALTGWGAFFAASTKAPTTAVLLLLEMTRDQRILPPLLAATAASVWVSYRLSPFSIYTLGLHRRGVIPPGREEAEPSAG